MPSPPPPPPSSPPPLPPSPRLPRRLLSSLLGYSHHLLHLPLPPSFPMAAARTSFPSPLLPSLHFYPPPQASPPSAQLPLWLTFSHQSGKSRAGQGMTGRGSMSPV
ncbi:hypothetical protein Vretimale_12074 [Volvox reticuliferus]|uniref:Uncharacterized protein n=1 Tax=Volvox reticuliferus TaxID=1737510 RepID=A0A8J4GIR2_9CHLO|nr:hypothetical protein Vretifemale_9537 [Volvox reticuliferus]GIM08018.1 hypothetical protein Vretimale_12074 [Volvox reticuliferus]